MQDHRNERALYPHVDSAQYRAQRAVLLELVVTPPPEGDRIDALSRRLELSRRAVRQAVVRLEIAGLAQRHGGVVRASGEALYFEYLWPVRL